MSKILFRIAFPIAAAAVFVAVSFAALYYQNLDVNFFIVLLALIAFISLFSFAAGQEIAFPLKKILRKATELSQGDLTARAYLDTRDEIGELSKVFNKIAEKLEEDRIAIENAEKSVDIKVKARTQALEETIEALEQKVKNRTIELQRLLEEFEKLNMKVKNKSHEAEELKKQTDNLKENLKKR